MAINLQKGQKIDLRKANPGLNSIRIGLGWDPVKSGGGFFKALMGGQQSVDCDASVLMLNNQGKLESNNDLIYFGNLRSSNNAVMHTGDNLTGDGDGDDEQILVDLDRIPSHVNKLLFVVNIYDCVARKQHFGMIQNAFIRAVDTVNKSEVVRYNLSNDYASKTSLVVGTIYRQGNTWQFSAVGEGTNDTCLKDVVANLSKIECACGI